MIREGGGTYSSIYSSILDRFAEWCTQNQLTINTKKSKCVLFGSKKFTKIKDLPVIILNNKVLDYVDSYKYLGVTLDRNLNFQQYVREVFNLVSHKIYMLTRIRQFINKDVSLLIYKTKILPYLDYGDILYDGADSKSLVRLQKLQNRALRVCLNSAEPLSRRELHARTRMPLLEHRRNVHLRNFMFKRKDDISYQDINPLRTGRHDAVLAKTIRANYTAFERSVFYRGSKEWNKLGVIDRCIESYQQFKYHQKLWLCSTVNS